MATPKRRHTKSRRDMRRAQHDKITAPNLSACSNCSAPTLPGRICPSCGFYKGRAVIATNAG
ncbi:MAG TPA: 50S ribosomal protein L32 [Polyangiaceae bacterium]|nr:50S ribosomal protein L32 [Polyangiaceae bacterium]